jgi:hypothetical protein
MLISRTCSLSANEPPAALADGDHYRDMAGRLRELARLTHSAGVRKQLAALAKRYDGVAGHSDGRSRRAHQRRDRQERPEVLFASEVFGRGTGRRTSAAGLSSRSPS